MRPIQPLIPYRASIQDPMEAAIELAERKSSRTAINAEAV